MLGVHEIKDRLFSQLRSEGGLSDEIKENDSLLTCGISSITVMKILSEWIKMGYKVPFSELIRNPYIDQWAEIIAKSYKGKTDKDKTNKAKDSKDKANKEKSEIIENMYEPFDLTDVQYAYWIGRDQNQKLGGVGCHGYFEVDCENLDLNRLNEAWHVLFRYHPMLRAGYTRDGKQKILKKPFHQDVQIIDLNDFTNEEREEQLLRIREERSHRLLEIERGEVISIVVTCWDKTVYRMHFEIDLLVCDVQSFGIILRDLGAYYLDGKRPKAQKEWNFAHYLAWHTTTYQAEIDEAKAYWRDRVKTLSSGPKLPMKSKSSSLEQLKFHRHSADISADDTARLKEIAGEQGVTLAVLLLTAYGFVISKWSQNKKFLMNMPMFNRENDDAIQNVVADFTNLLLVEMDFSTGKSFAQYLQDMNHSFLESMDHSACSGVEILREFRKQMGEDADATIVFSCNLGNPLVGREFKEAFNDISYMISQTPQVLIDFQAFTALEGLNFIWDAADGMFSDHMVDEIFDCFVKLIHEILSDDKDLNALFDVSSLSQIKHYNEATKFTYSIPKDRNMLTGIFANAKKYPDKVALIQPGREEVTYQELVSRVKTLASRLQHRGVKKGDYVAVIMPRGMDCVISEIAVMAAGAAYVPISIEQPELRRNTIIETAGCKAIIVEERITLQGEITQIVFDEKEETETEYNEVTIEPQDSAYVIFTSGSTGNPKGVEIAHGAAMNTIDDVNNRYKVNENDRAIAVSSNDFDLSIYDIFGLLSQGGSLVLITNEQKRNASVWLSYVKKYQVSIWNSVPTLFKMVLIEAENEKKTIDSLRLAILSGDWISLDIPNRIEKIAKNTHLAAMGGATEAAIWSNVFDVDEKIPEDWASIPYGGPLSGQFYRVMGEDGKDCPDNVIGELWIGGAGVAKRYLGDNKLTEEKFVEELGIRWYRTGDNGKFWPNGIIEFIGRRDNQIKLRGHRIELGEIESALNSCSFIQQSAALIHEKNGNKQLCAFVTGDQLVDETDITNIVEAIKELPVSDFNMEKDRETGTLIKGMTSEVAKQLIEHLSDRKTMSCSEKYQHVIETWKTISNRKEKDYVSGAEEQTKLIQAFVRPFIMNANDIIFHGLNPNELLLKQDFISPNVLASSLPRGQFLTKRMSEIIRVGQRTEKTNYRVLEIGARDLKATESFVNEIDTGSYTLLDKTLFFINAAKHHFGSKDHVNFLIVDLDVSDFVEEPFDLIIFHYTLHQFEDIDAVLRKTKQVLKKNGILLITEMLHEMELQSMTSEFLLPKEYKDIRKETGKALIDYGQWKKVIEEHGLKILNVLNEDENYSEEISQTLFAVTNSQDVYEVFEEKRIKAQLSKLIPEYMIPEKIKVLRDFPLTANGKVDRKELLKNNENWLSTEKITEVELPKTDTEKRLSEVWKTVLNRAVGRYDNYFRLGGDSLLATILVGRIREEFQKSFTLEQIFQYPVLADLAKAIELLDDIGDVKEEKLTLIEDKEHEFDPFPLTDVQQAYWIGRADQFNYSDVTTHCYFEMDCKDFDLKRAEDVLNELILNHGMLRAVILKDGEHQQILEKTDRYEMKLYDARDHEQILEELRKEMSQEQFDINHWPLFDIRAARRSERESRLFISFDNIAMDGFSMFYLFREWAYYVANPEKKPVQELISFRDYILSYQALKQMDQYKEDLAYWQKKLPEISPAPEFSIFSNDINKSKKFSRFSATLEKETWSALSIRLKEKEITPAVFLMGTYAETLARWCVTPKFSINLTRFHRMKFSENIEATLGDYTSLTIHSIDLRNGQNFEERLKFIQQGLWEDLNHPLVSGIEVERMLNKAYGTGNMPVVFTCGLGLTNGKKNEMTKYPGKIIYGNSQTPQVWLDYQVYEDEGSLSISWDALIDIFPEHMIKDMFLTYTQMLNELATNDLLWTQDTKSIANTGEDRLRLEVNHTDKWVEKNTLTELLLQSFERNKQCLAVIDERCNLTYEELYKKAKILASAIRSQGIGYQDIVAICLVKGWEQIVAIVAILLNDAIYLPLNYNAPKERNEKIVHISGAKLVIDQESFERLIRDEVDEFIPTKKARPDDLAYIIYTSGTTGEPKGVAIEHFGAVNTILDINERLKVTDTDRTIAISDLSFDLSVYDIFGMLLCGGAIVLPKQGMVKEPSELKHTIEKNKVTIWNTVPMFMEMFTQYLFVHPFEKKPAIKHILMSGDWIPLSISEDINRTIGTVDIYGLGGATEASIWSNLYKIDGSQHHLRSIPYGKPLANQRYYILDEMLLDCPYDVIGDLYIAGDGLAREYYNNEEETRRSFIFHESKKQRLYKTGDKALYMRDGNIEFCGRRDGQVKIAGFRIELGEINHLICSTWKVKQVESIVRDSEIFTFIKETRDFTEKIDIEKIEADLKKKLPHYMIPTKIKVIKEIPLTQNGKVDRKKLYSMATRDTVQKKIDKTQWTELENELYDLWVENLQIETIAKDDDFIQLGGNSLAAVQLVNKITQKYQIEFILSDFYENASIEKLAHYIELAIENEETGEL